METMSHEPVNHGHAGSENEKFERQLSENSMEYMIFILDESLEGMKYLKSLEMINKEATKLMETVAKNYIWQRDDFRMELINKDGMRNSQLNSVGSLANDKTGLIYLYGTTDYGDAVEDEWLIVFVLRELSKAHPQLCIRVADEDGEFLLVEAANALPNWLNPELDHCRVWIQGGQLRIIPLHNKEMNQAVTKSLTLLDAVSYLRANPDSLIHSPAIEDEAFYRLKKYPAHIEASIHHSTITIPRKLAHIIHELPKTISAAVEAFYLRDHTTMKRIASKSEELHLPPTDFVTVSVRFSRILFAQLRSQRFDAPPRWQNIILKQAEDDAKCDNVITLEDGMKLTCGYEMLAMSAENHKNRSVRELDIVLRDVREDGDEELPTNEDIEKWHDVTRNDSEGWLDINYEDFERELDGKSRRTTAKGGSDSGFGDTRAQEDLRKIVSRFEAFLNNETAGIEGAEIDEMDADNDDLDNDSDETDDNSDLEDKGVNFDEAEFSRLMTEMMGMPANIRTASSDSASKGKAAVPDTVVQPTEGEVEDIKSIASQMEAELKGHGALRLDSSKSEQGRLEDGKQESGKSKDKKKKKHRESGADKTGSDDEVDIDYNLAKNLLESFKSQGGMAGPTGNLIGLMGFQLPRDEDEGENEKVNAS